MFRSVFRRLKDNGSSRKDDIVREVDKWLDSVYRSMMAEFDDVQDIRFGMRDAERPSVSDDLETGMKDQHFSSDTKDERAEYSESILSQIDSIKKNVRATVTNNSKLERTPFTVEVKDGVRYIEVAHLYDESRPLSYIHIRLCG